MSGNITQTKGYTSSYRGANAPSAFALVNPSDFGEPVPALVNGNLAYNAGAGSLAMGTAFAKITWITAEGESAPSAEASVAIAAGSGAFTITQPTVPTNGSPVIGWRVYSAGTTAVEQLNTAAGSTTQVQQNFTTTQGVLAGFPVSQTTVQVKIYGTGASVPSVDRSGIQPALPSVPAANTANAAGGSADYFFVIPNANGKWKNYKSVGVIRPNSVSETTGITANYPFDCQSPLYPGATPGSSAYSQVSVAPGTYMVMNGVLFQAIQSGSQNTAATFIGGAAFNVSKGATVTDGSVTWLCLGENTLVHARFENAGNNPAIPTAQEYDLFQL